MLWEASEALTLTLALPPGSQGLGGCEPSLQSSHSASATMGRTTSLGERGWGLGGVGAHQNHVNQFSRISQVGFPRTRTRQQGLTTVQASHSPVPLCVSCLGRGGLNESWASLCHLKTRCRVNGFQKLSCFIGLTCGNVFFNRIKIQSAYYVPGSTQGVDYAGVNGIYKVPAGMELLGGGWVD